MKKLRAPKAALCMSAVVGAALLLGDVAVGFPAAFRIPLYIVFSLFSFTAVRITSRERSMTSPGRRATMLLTIYFILYLYCLVSVTLLDPAFGRTSGAGGTVNLVPFATVWGIYLSRGLLGGAMAPWWVLLNLGGNLIVLAPLAVFLPYLFPRARRWYVFLPAVLLCSAAIEALQYTLRVGACDVDDLLLNTLGAFCVFGILKIPALRDTADRILAF